MAVLKQGTVLMHYIFMSRMLEIFDKIRQILRFLIDLFTMDYDRRILHSEAKRLITTVI